MSRRLPRAAALAVTAASALLVVAAPRPVRAQSCYNLLAKDDYSGFDQHYFQSLSETEVTGVPGYVQLKDNKFQGQAIAVISSYEINTPGDYTISKIRISAEAAFPAPCPPGATLGGAAGNRVDIYWSVDNGVTFFPVVFPPGTTTTGDVLIDPLALGVSGNRLVWRANFFAATNHCQPRLIDAAIGYQAIRGGTYSSTEPIPIGNVMVRASYELGSSTWPADRTPRGHLQVKQLYSLDTVPLTDYTAAAGPAPPNAGLWTDAGSMITFSGASTGPNQRFMYYSGGANVANVFSTAVGALLQLVLPFGSRGVQYNGNYVYDFDNSNNVANDDDAKWLIEWVRGWANGTTKSQHKPWGLGAIQRSTPAIVTPPGDPWWLSLPGTPSAERTAFGTPCGDPPELAPPPAPPATPAVPPLPNFLQARRFRNSVVVVGAQDGLLHAFDFGKFRWCDDLGTTPTETRGWFSYRGARNYGDGKEVWAFAAPGQMNDMRRAPPRPAAWAISQGLSRPNADAAITVADVCTGGPPCSYKTILVAPETRDHPFITALDVTDPNLSPKPLWGEDWPPDSENDTTFEGTEVAVSLGPVSVRNPAPGLLRRWEIATTSGMSNTLRDLYLYLVDVQSGQTWKNAGVRDGWGRVKLNVAGANADCSGQVYGSAGPPVMVDSNVDGVVDRVYVVDTKGCVYKVETASMQTCVVAALGETVYAPMAVRVADDVTGRVELFIGGGDDPDRQDLPNVPPRFHLFALEDDDTPGSCTAPKSLFTVELTPAGAPPAVSHKLWAAPVVSGDAVYVGTSVGDLNNPCSSDPANPGLLEGWEITPSALAGPRQVFSPVSLGGNAVGGIRLFDSHLFANTSNGSTTVFGRQGSWGNSITSVNPNGGSLLSTPLWQER